MTAFLGVAVNPSLMSQLHKAFYLVVCNKINLELCVLMLGTTLLITAKSLRHLYTVRCFIMG